MKENILDVLKNLNFTEYESKAYLALLEESPLTGYAVAKKIGCSPVENIRSAGEPRDPRRYLCQLRRHTAVHPRSRQGTD